MKNRMSEIDDLIKETLTKEEAEFYDDLDEQNPFEMIGGLFRGKNSWIIIIINIVMLIAFAAFIYCVVNFLEAEETNELIRWAAGGFTCFFAVLMLKLFGWMQMDKNAILREMKRLELQISSLAVKKA